MIDTFLKAFGIIISIVVLWFGLIMFSPVPVFSSSIIKLSYLSIIPCIATIASIAIAYKYSPKFKLGAGVLAMILSYIMAYPVFGAGLGLDVSLKLERYNYVTEGNITSSCTRQGGSFGLVDT